jgi:hypothetical protein
VDSIKVVLRNMRILHATFLTTIFLYLFMLSQIRPVAHEVQPQLVYGLAFASLTDLGIALYFRARKVQVSEERLRTNPGDVSALAEWRAGTILSFVFAESIALFGVLLKGLGAEWKIAGLFFAFGLLLMLFWTPRLDVPSVGQ